MQQTSFFNFIHNQNIIVHILHPLAFEKDASACV